MTQPSNRLLTKSLLAGLLVAAVASSPDLRAAEPAPPNLREPVLRLPPMATPPVMDGRIGDDEWAGAWMMQGSVGSADQALEERPAWAYVAYDKDNLYVAIRSATRPGGRLYMWEHDPDEALMTMDGIEVWVAALDNPAQPPIDRFQLWYDPYGTQWALVHRYGAGFNVQEKLPRGTSITNDEWHFELTFPWRLAGLKPGDIRDGKQILVRPCRNWSHHFIYSTWGGVGPFYLTDNMMRITLDRTAPVVRIPSLGDPFAGKAAVTVEVRNPGAKPVDVQARLSLGTYSNILYEIKPGIPLAEDSQTLTIPAGKTGTATLTATFDPPPLMPASRMPDQRRDSHASLKLDVTRASDGAVLFSRFMKIPDRREKLWADMPLRPASVRGGYYPYFGKVNARIDLGDDPRARSVTRAVITVSSTNTPAAIRATGDVKAFPYGKGEVILDVGALPPGGYAIRADLYAGETQLAFDKPLERLFVRAIMPWENTTAGISDKVYPPFTPIEVKGRTVSCVLRNHEMNGLGLWDQVEAKGEPLFTGPMRLEGRSGGKALDFKQAVEPRFTKKAGHETVLEGGATCSALTAKTLCRWEYDGMMKVELDLAPAGEGQVDELALVIPVKASIATLLHSTTATRSNPSMEIPAGQGVVWDSRNMVQSIGKGSFTPYLWIGGVERGVCWFADNDQGWITDDKEPALTLERAGDTVNLRVRFINRPGVVKGPRHIVFGLMATPVKPIPAESRAWWNSKSSPRDFVDCLSSWRFVGFSNKETLDPLGGDFSIFSYFAQHQGTGKRPADSTEFLRAWMLKHVKEPEKGGLLAQLDKTFSSTVAADEAVYYTNPALEDGSTPQGRQFGSEWRGGISSMGCNFVRSYNDYAAWCYDQMLATGLKCGVYQDNTFPVPSTDLISGSAYVREDGRIQAGWNMFGHRDFYKRLFVTGWARLGKMPLVYPHTTNGEAIPLFSFATIQLSLEWEQKSLRTFQEKFTFPLLRTEVMGKQAGLIPRVLCAMGESGDAVQGGYLTRTREGVLLLHDSYPRGLGPYIGDVIKHLMPLGFHKKSCDFIGYWEKPALVKAPAGTEISLFKMEKGILAVVVDTSGQEGVRRVSFDTKAIGRPIADIRDFEADCLVKLRDDPDPYLKRIYAPEYSAYGVRWVYFHPARGFKKTGSDTVEFNLRKHDYALLLVE